MLTASNATSPPCAATINPDGLQPAHIADHPVGGAGSNVSSALAAAVARGDLPGVVACAANGHDKIYSGAFGYADVAAGQPIRQDSLFFIASMTKAVTTVAIMQLIEQGCLSLDDPAAGFLPKLLQTQVLEGFHANGAPKLRPPRKAVTVRHLLAYTAGFAYPHWNEQIKRYVAWAGLPDTISYLERSLDLPMVSDPGERWHYGINSEYLGKIVESVSGLRLDRYFQRHIFDPLGMSSTGYVVRPDERHRLAQVHTRLADGSLSPVTLTLPENPEYYPGGVGLFSTAADYLALTRMLLGNGVLNGRRLLKEDTVAMMGRNQLETATMAPLRTCDAFWSRDVDFFPGEETQWGLGFMLNTRRSPHGREAFSLSWAGACNTFYWLDPARQVTGVFMTSVVPFCDARALAAFETFESSIYAML